MMRLDDIKKNDTLIHNINWDMTPEDAVGLYLEWGSNWSRGTKYVIRGKEDVSHYFVVNTWDDPPVIYLMRRNSDEAVELAKIHMPEWLKNRFLDSIGHNKGVYSIEGEVKKWLKKQLNYLY